MKRVELYILRAAIFGLLGAFDQQIHCTAREPQILSTRVGTPDALERLPEHVPSNDGKLTLFADYSDVRGDHVVLYLINRTDRRIGFSAQDSDPYVKLEALSESGQWERAQRHVFSWCGNSYMAVPALCPGEFFRFLGYYPTEGDPSVVRYRIFRDSALVLNDPPDELESYGIFPEKQEKIPLNLVSNEGRGRVLKSDIDMARYDKLAVRFGSFDAIREMALGLAEPSTRTWERRSRKEAVDALQRFPDKRAAAAFEILLNDKEERIRGAAVRGLGIIGQQCAVAESRFQDLLKDADVRLRAAAIQALSDRPMDLEIIDNMQLLLAESEMRIRAAALGVLGKACREFPDAHAVILEHKYDPDPVIRSFLNKIHGVSAWCPPFEEESENEP